MSKMPLGMAEEPGSIRAQGGDGARSQASREPRPRARGGLWPRSGRARRPRRLRARWAPALVPSRSLGRALTHGDRGGRPRAASAVPGDRAARAGLPRSRPRQPRLLGDLREPGRFACSRSARWPRVGVHAVASPAVRSGRVPRRAVRSARLRPQHAACERARDRSDDQHHRASGRGHGAPPPVSLRGSVARGRRIVGLHVGSRLRGGVPGTGHGDDPVGCHDGTAGGMRLALPRRSRATLSSGVGPSPGRRPGVSTRSGHRGCLLPPPPRRRSRRPPASRARLVHVGVGDARLAPDKWTRGAVRRSRLRPGVRPHRDALRPARPLPRGRHPAPGSRPARRHPWHARERPVRPPVPDGQRLGAPSGMASSRARGRRGSRPCRRRRRHHPIPDRGDRTIRRRS